MRIALPIALFIVLLSTATLAQSLDAWSKKAVRMVRKNAVLLQETSQLLVVFSEFPESQTAWLVALEKKGNNWSPVFGPVQAGIGRKGFAAPGEKREGDQKSPSGLFRLGQLFCYEKAVDTRIPFVQSTADDKWIDDPDSPDYNRWVRGETTAKSYERLLLKGNDYRYCMVIEYNTHPVVKGNGSAIFLHLSEFDTINSSSGCVVLIQSDMEKLLKWMDPKAKPSILMGTRSVLLDGLKKDVSN